MNQVSLGRRGPLCGALGLATLVLAFAAPVALAGSSHAYSPIDPDLRTVSSTTLIGVGDVQVETSFARSIDGDGTASVRQWSTPSLVRFGMPNYELRVSTGVWSRVSTSQAIVAGVPDMTLGLKTVVPQTWDRDLSLAVMLQATFPSGSAQIRNKGTRPEVQFVGGWQLPSHNSIGAVAGMRSDVDTQDQRFVTGQLGLDFTHNWNPAFFTYGEVAAREIRSSVRGGKNIMYGLGAGWRAFPGTQLDASAGWGLKDNDTDMAFSIGVSRRFHPPSPETWGNRQQPDQDDTQRASDEGD